MQPLETERIQLLDRREPPSSLTLTLPPPSPTQFQRKSVIATIVNNTGSSNSSSPHHGTTPPEDITTRDTSNNSNNYRFVFYDLSRAGLLGTVTGASVAVFKLCIESLRLLAYSLPVNKEGRWSDTFMPFIPALGGLIVGLLALCVDFPPGLRGTIQETDRDSKAKFFGDECNKQFSAVAFLLKTIAAIFTLGTGCSLGPGKFYYNMKNPVMDEMLFCLFYTNSFVTFIIRGSFR
jgi:hypothetical protein